MNYDKTKYKIITWKNPQMLHWILNPGIAFNELAFGQRIPKVTLQERNSSKTLAERIWIPCPHCQTLHSGLKWSLQNKTAFRNWFGLYCDNCEKTIPCLTNLTSYLILGLSFPIWIWFKDKWKTKWLESQKLRFSKPLDMTPKAVKWWLLGLFFGISMYITMTIVFPLIYKGSITKTELLIGIPAWTLGGLVFALLMKWMVNRKIKSGITTNNGHS